jgi:hypothetical protein
MSSLVPHPQDDNYEDYQADLKWQKDHNLKFKGKGTAALAYGGDTCSWGGFSMTDDSDPSKRL